MDISDWLREATKQLKAAGIESSRLDAELILAATLRKNRSYLHTHLDDEIEPRRLDIANARLQLRSERVPIAYILGHKEFYGRNFTVSPQVLIPRPESEMMIELFLEVSASDISGQSVLIDIGTGSGCLGITAKLERPEVIVILSDISHQALAVADRNAQELQVTVKLQHQDLLSGQIEPLNYILANLPYVSPSWTVSPELQYEPQLALYASEGGLELIFRLIEQTKDCLVETGWLILEADTRQHQLIADYAASHRLELVKTAGYCMALRRRETT